MTNVNNNNDRLNQIQDELETVKELLLATANIVNSNGQDISRLIERVDLAVANQDRMEARFETFIEQAEQDRALMREMQTEVRGLQAENRRILEYLFGERENEL